MAGKINIAPVEKDDLDFMLEMWKNPDIMDYWFNEPYMNKEKLVDFYEKNQKEDSLRHFIAFDGEKRIGYTSLFHINLRHRTAIFAIMLDPNNHGKGYAEKVMRKVVDYGFFQLNLNKITLDVVDYNEKAIHIYEKLGFTVEGTMEQQYFIQGNYYNSLSMGLLKENYLREKN